MATDQRAGGLSPGFSRFWWGEAVSGFGNAITGLALQTLVVLTLQGSASEVGWLNASRWLPYLVFGLVVGALVDRTARRRPLMIGSDLLRAALLALIPLAWVLDWLTFGSLLAIVLAFGTVSLVNDAASMSFIPRLVAKTHLQRAHARLDGADAVAQTAGPAIAGVLIRVLGAPLAVLIDALTYVFSAVMVATVRDVAEPRKVRPRFAFRALVDDIREGARWVYGKSGLARLAVATHVWFVAQAVVVVVVVPYALIQLRMTALALGLALAVGGVGALVGAMTSTRIGSRLGTGGAIIGSHAVSAVGVFIMVAAGVASTPWWAAAILAVGQWCHGFAMGVSNSHEMSFRQSLTPDALQARTNTTMRSLNRAVVVVVSPIAGLLADRIGFPHVLGFAAAIFVVSALLLSIGPIRQTRIE